MFRSIVLVCAAVTTGLMAGLFAAFSYAVMPGLGRTDDRTFVVAMQQINKAILNGWFALCFVGALLCTVVALLLHLRRGGVALWIGVALALYVATLVVTMGFNVPLNNRLEAASGAGFAAARERFETSWVAWNVVRAVANTAALGCLCWALLLAGQRGRS